MQLTWLTLYYENIGSTYVERPAVNLLSTSLRFFAPPVIFDMDNDGEAQCQGTYTHVVFFLDEPMISYAAQSQSVGKLLQ